MNVAADVLPQLRSEGHQKEASNFELMIAEARSQAKSLQALVTPKRLDDLSACIDGRSAPGREPVRSRGAKTFPGQPPVSRGERNGQRAVH